MCCEVFLIARQVSRVLPEWRIGEVFMSVVQSKPKQNTAVEIVRMVLATIAALAAASLLVYNVVSFADAIEYYLSMGYPADEVYKHLIPSQLLPGLFEPIAIYGGIAFLLFYAGWFNRMATACQATSTEPNPGSNAGERSAEPEMFMDSSVSPETIEESSTEPVTNATANPEN